MNFEFDPDKDATNREKHGVSLAFAAGVLGDENRLDILDVRFSFAEERYISYGRVYGRIFVCIFTVRGDTRRIISVRKANGRETQRDHNTQR